MRRVDETGRVLLVDDEQAFLEPTSDMLVRLGHECRTAPGASEATEWLNKEPFDVVISDIRMPGNHHLEFVKQLCAQDDGPAVIVVTGFPSVDSAVGSLDLRVFAYLVKPVEIETLRERVDEAVRQVRIRRSMSSLGSRLAQLREDVQTVHEVFRKPQPEIDATAVHQLVDGTSRVLREGLRDLGQLEPAQPTPLDPVPPAQGPVPATVDLSVLSPREQEVLELIRNGYRVATVARRLFISPHTVRNHLKRIFLKLEVGSQAELLEKLKPLAE